jgi:hypothetical protein
LTVDGTFDGIGNFYRDIYTVLTCLYFATYLIESDARLAVISHFHLIAGFIAQHLPHRLDLILGILFAALPRHFFLLRLFLSVRLLILFIAYLDGFL